MSQQYNLYNNNIKSIPNIYFLGTSDDNQYDSSDQTQDYINPPLSKEEALSNIEEIKESISELLSDSGEIASNTVNEMGKVLQDFMKTAVDEKQSMMELGGLLTLKTTSRVKQLGGLTVSAPNVASKMLYENILVYYSDTLTEIHDKGYAKM